MVARSKLLAQNLGRLKALERLDMSSSQVSSDSAKVLAVAISKLVYLTYLNLSHNGFGSKEAEYICAVLPNLVSLVELKLSGSRMDDVADVLARSARMHSLLCVGVGAL